MDSSKRFQNLVLECGFELPAEYVTYLESSRSKWMRNPATGGVNWLLLDMSATSRGLFCPIQLDKYSIEAWQTPKALARVLRDVGVTELNGQRRLSVDEFEKGIAIGKSEGDYLFLTPDGNVWCFWHDGHEAKKLADNWAAWLAGSSQEDSSVEGVSKDAGSHLIGSWTPVSSSTENPELFELLAPSIHFSANGKVTETFPDGSLLVSDWIVNESYLILTRPEGVARYHYDVGENELDITLDDGSYHSHLTRG